MSNFNIFISNSANTKIKYLTKNNNLKLRIRVEGGGCSGFSYKYELVELGLENDFVIEESSVLIDQLSQPFLNNCTLDYIEQLGGSYFEIKNPNASGKCGCGQSFSFE